MKASELRELSDQELEVKERELRESVFRLRMRRGTNQLEKPAVFKQAKRDIARIKTIIGDRMRAQRMKQVG